MNREDSKSRKNPPSEDRSDRRSGRLKRSVPSGLLSLFAVVLIFPVVACADSREAAEPSRSTSATNGDVRAVRIANFEAPVEAEVAPGFPRLLFVVERGGRVMVMNRGRKLNRPFLDIGGRISSGGEQGLLSIAFPPDYRKTGRFYLYFTDRDGDIRIEEFRRSTPTTARTAGRRVIEIPHPSYDNHNGGQMHFLGNLLYFGTGDGGGGGDPEGNAQNVESLLGKLIRIDPRRAGGRPYTVPVSNPFVGGPGRDEIYSTGLRNPFRWSFDLRQAGSPRIFLADVGEADWEEINYLTVSAARGANFGWNAYEGRSPFDGFSGSRPDGTVVPKVVMPHPDNCSVIGGIVVEDPGLGALRGRYLFADFCRSGLLSTSGRPADGAPVRGTGINIGQVSSIGEGSGNRVLVTSLSGGLYRLR